LGGRGVGQDAPRTHAALWFPRPGRRPPRKNNGAVAHKQLTYAPYALRDHHVRDFDPGTSGDRARSSVDPLATKG